jgi:DNA mismatch endonuclease (patch repair protein)
MAGANDTMSQARHSWRGVVGRAVAYAPRMSENEPRLTLVVSSPEVSGRMQRQRRKNTAPERALRGALHRRGLRFRIHTRPDPGLRREADIVFARARVAVFVNGCFWHGCEEHATWPNANADWWRAKLEKNRARDRETDERLQAAGWLSIRVWEHEDPEAAAETIAAAISSRLARP